MSGIIHVLNDAVANQIAAGEVIQRPASIVKELMENAVDAEATVIKVVIKDAGKTLVQVTDNGMGMSEEDAVRCFERHATSKITSAEDLFSIQTSGFRGEALASMAAVSEVVMRTRRAVDELGTQVRMAASKLESKEHVQAPIGTHFQVRNLFFNIPARRKFLKSDQTEMRHIINEFNHVALTHPELEFLLIHNDAEIYHLTPANQRQRIIGAFGKSVNSYLIPLETETSLVKITGFIGKPEHARKTYGEQFFFVNKRFIKHPYFHKAIMSGYEQILQADHIPSYFIFFETDPARIDVNIHPSKTEVKFEDEHAIWQIVLAAVKEAIGKHNLSPSLDFSKEGIIDIPVLTKDTEVRQPGIKTDPSYNPFEADQKYQRSTTAAPYALGLEIEGEQIFDPLPEKATIGHKILQIKNKYILSPVKSGLMIIDQRRAHERILFERIKESLSNRQPLPQQSLFPEVVTFQPVDYLVCQEMLAELNHLGFDIRDGGDNQVVVHGVPAGVSGTGIGDTLEMMIEQYKSVQGNMDLGHDERIAGAAARAAAIHYGESLEELEMQELIDSLFACQNPHHSPTGKPIVRIIALDELDRYFKE